MDRLKRGYLLFTAVIILALAFLVFNKDSRNNSGFVDVTLGGQKIKAEVADSEELRTKGLSERENLPKNKGMLFVFEKADHHQFWMKDMKFSIDIIWINEGRVVDIVENAKPWEKGEANHKVYSPAKSAKYVLEVNAGFVSETKIGIDDEVKSSIFQENIDN